MAIERRHHDLLKRAGLRGLLRELLVVLAPGRLHARRLAAVDPRRVGEDGARALELVRGEDFADMKQHGV